MTKWTKIGIFLRQRFIYLILFVRGVDMTTCRDKLVYCQYGCCGNVTLYCCNITCNDTHIYCSSPNEVDRSMSLLDIFLRVCVGAVLIFLFGGGLSKIKDKWSDCSRSNCARDSTSELRNKCHAICVSCRKLDCNKIKKTLGEVLLSPCICVNWLQTTWRQRFSSQSQSVQTTSGSENSSNVVTPIYLDGRDVLSISFVRPTQTHESSNDFLGSTDLDICSSQSDNATTDFIFPISNMDFTSTTFITVSPPSYEEATRNDPPSYIEATSFHQTNDVRSHI